MTRANAALEQAARLKDEFLATMSHELRTPLTGILGLSETLQIGIYGALTDQQKDVVRIIHEGGNHLLNLINDILDLSKIQAGRLELMLEPLFVSEICQTSLQLVSQLALKKNQRLALQLDESAAVVRADARRLKQILVNLLGNAVNFMPEGGQIGLTVEGDPGQGQVRFAVWDTGPGILPAN